MSFSRDAHLSRKAEESFERNIDEFPILLLPCAKVSPISQPIILIGILSVNEGVIFSSMMPLHPVPNVDPQDSVLAESLGPGILTFPSYQDFKL